MENYAKVMLYVYPFLKTVEKDYQDHIRNKAVLSHNSGMTAERLADYIAGEIIIKGVSSKAFKIISNNDWLLSDFFAIL